MNFDRIQQLAGLWDKAERRKDTVRAALIREMLETELAKTVPEKSERAVPYLDYVSDGGCLTYDQWLGLVEEQEREASTPIDTSENPSPF